MPVTIGLVGGSLLFGLGKAIFSGKKKKEQALERYNQNNAPMYKPDKGIQDYFKEAQNKYNVSPYQSQQYQMAEKQANQNEAAGLSNLQGRRSAIGGVANLVNASNNAMAKAGVNAENERNQRFGILGNATQMNAAENRKAFNTNVEQPFERQYNLLAQKAAQAAKQQQSGLNTIGNALGAGTMLAGSGMLGNGAASAAGGMMGADSNNYMDNSIPNYYSTYMRNRRNNPYGG